MAKLFRPKNAMDPLAEIRAQAEARQAQLAGMLETYAKQRGVDRTQLEAELKSHFEDSRSVIQWQWKPCDAPSPSPSPSDPSARHSSTPGIASVGQCSLFCVTDGGSWVGQQFGAFDGKEACPIETLGVCTHRDFILSSWNWCGPPAVGAGDGGGMASKWSYELKMQEKRWEYYNRRRKWAGDVTAALYLERKRVAEVAMLTVLAQQAQKLQAQSTGVR